MKLKHEYYRLFTFFLCLIKLKEPHGLIIVKNILYVLVLKFHFKVRICREDVIALIQLTKLQLIVINSLSLTLLSFHVNLNYLHFSRLIMSFIMLSFSTVFSLAKLMNVDEDASHLSAIARYICSGLSCIIICLVH